MLAFGLLEIYTSIFGTIFPFMTKLVLMILFSLTCWGILAYSSILLINTFEEHIHIFGWSACFIQVIFGVVVCQTIHLRQKENKVGIYTLIGRGIIGRMCNRFLYTDANAGHAALAGIASVYSQPFSLQP